MLEIIFEVFYLGSINNKSENKGINKSTNSNKTRNKIINNIKKYNKIKFIIKRNF